MEKVSRISHTEGLASDLSTVTRLLKIRLDCRPKHALYEDMQPLFANPVLPLLAIALADDIFMDYHSFEDIEAVPPPADGSLHHLRIKREMFNTPVFRRMSPDGPIGKIVTASTYSHRLVALGHRAGYPENITVHGMRREILVKADGKFASQSAIIPSLSLILGLDHGYSTSQKMKFAGHIDPRTFQVHYAHQMSTIDGQSALWDKERRNIPFEAFRGLSLHHYPQLPQSLPAKVRDDLEHRDDFIALNKEIAALGENLRLVTTAAEGKQANARRKELYWERRHLILNELSKWQQIQLNTAKADRSAPVAALPGYFNRIRRLDPPRDRLAHTLFIDIPLRSDEGRSALHDFVTLCRENPKVAYRPSLQPKEGRCPVPTCAKEMDG
jgi:hypothetical protein